MNPQIFSQDNATESKRKIEIQDKTKENLDKNLTESLTIPLLKATMHHKFERKLKQQDEETLSQLSTCYLARNSLLPIYKNESGPFKYFFLCQVA